MGQHIVGDYEPDSDKSLAIFVLILLITGFFGLYWIGCIGVLILGKCLNHKD